MAHALAGGGVRLAAGRFASFQAEGEIDMQTYSPLSTPRRNAFVLAAVVAGASVVGSVLGLFGAAADAGAEALARAGGSARPAGTAVATKETSPAAKRRAASAVTAPAPAAACPGCQTTAEAQPQSFVH